MVHEPLITNDAVVLGVLAALLGGIFYTSQSHHSFWRSFYRYVPALLLCYLFPSFLNTFNIIDGQSTQVYPVAKYYLLPACLVLLTLSINFSAIKKLGNKALIMFFTGTVGVVIGGPLSLLAAAYMFPELLQVTGPEAMWRGMAALAGSWIGGGANMVAMKETFGAGGDIFTIMVTVDIVVANMWMVGLLYLAAKHKEIDAKSGADTSGIDSLIETVQNFEREHARRPELSDIMMLIGLAFGGTGLAHAIADTVVPFLTVNYPGLDKFSLHSKLFWIVILVTTIGLTLSFTRVRQLEAVGASKVGSAMLYILVATIGLQMDITKVIEAPKYVVVGVIWMLIHIVLLFIVGRLIKAPIFYLAVGSKANIGAAASAPVVASAFNPALAPVGVLLAVLGYALGTYMAWLCGLMMQMVSGG